MWVKILLHVGFREQLHGKYNKTGIETVDLFSLFARTALKKKNVVKIVVVKYV